MWRDTRDLDFMFDLSLPVPAELPLWANVLRDYTLKFEIWVERAFMDIRECQWEPVKDRDCYREIADTLMEDIEEMNSAQESELATLRAELDQRGLAPSVIEVEYVQLRSQVAGLKDELTALTWRFAILDHTWDEERAALEVGKAGASSRVDDLALELVQVRAYIHSTLSMEHGQEGDEPSKP